MDASALTGESDTLFWSGSGAVNWSHNLMGGSGSDTIWTGTLGDTVNSGAGNDMVRSGAGDDTILGGAGDDTIRGSEGDDSLDGGSGGYDWLDYGDGVSGITLSFISGTSTDGLGGTDSITNFVGVIGTSYADSMVGDAGDNRFLANEGNDTIDGGDGTKDEVYYTSSSGSVTVNLSTGTASDGFGGTDTLSNIERARGSSQNDTLIGDAGNNAFTGCTEMTPLTAATAMTGQNMVTRPAL